MRPRIAALCAAALAVVAAAALADAPATIHVNGETGSDAGDGTADRPLRTLSAAIARLPDPVTASVTVELAGAEHRTTGAVDMPANRLDLQRRMRPGVGVRIVGATSPMPVLAWEGGEAMVDAREGAWRLEHVQIGSFTRRQRRGVMVTGPAEVTLKDVTFRTRSQSDGAIYARRGGHVALRGAIRINEHLHEARPEEDTFSGIIAAEHGHVAFEEREGASLDIGNGSLSATYYGCIELRCASARVTSWSDQGNTLAINNGGRIDLHSTPVRLRAGLRANTPIGLEHDGHILAEGAHITIEGENDHAIVLQKVSSLMCNDIELKGTFRTAVSAMSGSVLVCGLMGKVGRIEADTGSHVTVERIDGELAGPVEAHRAASVALPDKVVVGK